MKPWREVAVPHHDVLEGTSQQADFAVDLSAVRGGRAPRAYQDPVAFFERTFITEGMGQLLTQVAQRLAGRPADPIIQIQTAFGGGKTHTMLAVYHLATRRCALGDLAGIPHLLDQAGILDVPQARVVVLDGNAHAPGQAWQHGALTVHTLWGELAWQLGGEEGFALVKEADATGTSPGKDVLQTLLEYYAPCVVLIDELVAYVRQFPEGRTLSGGTFDSNLSFIQALTEACKPVDNAILLASLPESEVEAGSQRGVAALKALEKYFGRVQALWKPVAAEESFEIVRRRLFEPVRDGSARATVCRAFADTYIGEGGRLPSETQEVSYVDRMMRSYPIHPEVFDRLYEDWTTIEGFQRTRGVLKLMARVIYRLWQDDNRDLMIMPGSVPLYDGNARNELTHLLNPGWDPVIDKDIDGDRAETTELESKEPRFGAVRAARRVARTIFLGSAPGSVATKPGIRGIDRGRILLGCLEPGQTSSTYADALNRLADRLHYLNSSGDTTQDTTRFWFDTRANLRREMEDRKGRFDDQGEVRGKLAEVLKRLVGGAGFFDGVHLFTPHADVPDDGALRLVVLAPEHYYARAEARTSADTVLDYVRGNGTKPRYRGNRLVFLAPDHAALARLRDCVRVALAWGSIVEDVKDGRLNIDQLQRKQAEKELQTAEDVLPRAARECYKWLLCPAQHRATDPTPTVEAFPVTNGGAPLAAEIERACLENELVITAWSPIHLRTNLQALYWKADRPAVGALAFWEDTLRYLYLPRLKSRQVLEQAIVKGAASRDFFGTAYGQHEGTYDGFNLGDGNVQLDDTLLLIEPTAAKEYEAAQVVIVPPKPGPEPGPVPGPDREPDPQPGPNPGPDPGPRPEIRKARAFIGTADVNAATAKMRLVQIAEEIIGLLASDPQATVHVSVEIGADFPDGVSDQLKRAVSENATSLSFRNKTWE